MRRIAIIVIVGAASLLAVSVGVSWQSPRPTPYVPVPAGQPPAYDPIPADQSPAYSPGNAFPDTGRTYATPIAPVPVAPTEPMIVKVYSVPDLVATVQVHRAAPSSFTANPELAQAMQQIQLQVQAAQYASVQAASPTEPSDEVTMKLERLKKALRVAAPKTSWADCGGEGEIEVYSEALCLIVRQTASGHEAIADLLLQLRATQDVQIELAVEMVTFDGVADDLAAEALRLLNRELSPEEVAQFRNCGAKTAMSSVLRMANGHSANTGHPELPLQFTAVTSADRSIVEFRTEVTVPMGADHPAMLQAFSQSRIVAVGKSIAFMVGTDGSIVLLVTPKVVDRSPAIAK